MWTFRRDSGKMWPSSFLPWRIILEGNYETNVGKTARTGKGREEKREGAVEMPV